MNRVAVIGAGAWGTALAVQAARAGNAVTLWARDPARAREIASARESPRLPGARLPDPVRVAAEMPEAADAVLLAVPMQHLRAIAGLLPPGRAPLVACAKGVEQGTLRLPLEVLAELHPHRPAAVLTGPNFAGEVAAGKPAATVVAAPDPALRARLADLLGTPGFRIYGNDDPIGAQVGGAEKNVVAIAAGAVIGAGLGENARAGLITRGLAELGRLAVALGGRAETVMGLSGLGDLLLTCTSAASRNFSLGLALGLASGVCYAGYLLGAKRLLVGDLSALELTVLVYVGPAAVYGVAALVRGARLPSGGVGWTALAGVVVLGAIAPSLLLFAGLRLVGAGAASAPSTVEPFVGVILPFAILGESLSALQLAGGALIVASVPAPPPPGLPPPAGEGPPFGLRRPHPPPTPALHFQRHFPPATRRTGGGIARDGAVAGLDARP